MRISIEHCRWTNHFIKPPGQAGNSFRGNKPVHSKQDQSWVFFGRFDARAETPILWPPHVKSWLSGKDSDAGRDCGQEKGTTEDEMARWYHILDGRESEWTLGVESEWTLGVGDGQGGLACCNSWGRKKSDTTEWLNWTELNWWYFVAIKKEPLCWKPLETTAAWSHGFQVLAPSLAGTSDNPLNLLTYLSIFNSEAVGKIQWSGRSSLCK